MGNVFFPLDEELELLPGSLTPHAHECLVRLGAWLPFEQGVALLGACLGVVVSEAVMRRDTEAAGAAYETVQCAEAGRIAREALPAAAGPAKLVVSVDGAMVPLLHGVWAEVKTLAIGVVGEPVRRGEEWVVQTRELSYFSRMVDAETFGQQALVEIQRRGVENAGRVAAVMDGAEWEQRFVEYHCPDAVRILDFAHAAERLGQIGAELWGEGQPTTQEWLERYLHRLKHTGPSDVLAELRDLHHQHPDKTVLAENLAYLEKRAAHMNYPEYQAQGWPIGSGMVESANKVVVEARLKGAGKHWARDHVDPMLALRNLVCNDRWDEGWPQITRQLRAEETQRRRALHDQRRVPSIPAASLLPDMPDLACKEHSSLHSSARPMPYQADAGRESISSKEPYRPPPTHPWRHSTIGRARFRPYHWDERSKN